MGVSIPAKTGNARVESVGHTSGTLYGQNAMKKRIASSSLTEHKVGIKKP